MSQGDLSVNYNDIRKNGYGFSFLSTAISLVNNRNFKRGEFDTYQTDEDTGKPIADTKDSYIWRTLSAIGEDVGGVIQENVVNFIDDVSNIELCKIQALQSMSEFTGTKYSVFQNIIDFPRELRQLMDVLSIKREYLTNLLKVNERFAKAFSLSVTLSSEAVSEVAERIQEARNLSSRLSSTWAQRYDKGISAYVPYGLSSSEYIDDQRVDSAVSAIYKDFIMDKLEQTYNDENNTVIWEHLSDTILLSDFELEHDRMSEIQEYKLKHNIDRSFDTEIEYDNIENGISSVDDYSQYEQYVLNLERERRLEPFQLSATQTKYKYYRESDVREYYKFVQDEYSRLGTTYLSADEYDVDNNYMQINDSLRDSLICCKVDVEHGYMTYLDQDKIDQVVRLITRITSELRAVREQLKVICQKNCMKGTYVLISYIINEYLKNNLRYSLSSVIDDLPEYDAQKNTVDFIEYTDITEYYNISTEVDTDVISGLNGRYWEKKSGLDAIGAIDNTNIFQVPPTVDSNNFALDLETIEKFYLQILQSKFQRDPDPEMPLSSQSQHFFDFLSAVFDMAADQTYMENGALCMDIVPELSGEKEDMFYRYTGLSVGDEPYCNIKNQRHPSYQIHPYLSNFMEQYDYSYPVENTVNMAADNLKTLLRDNLSNYIDADGYLTNTWCNPLNSNSDYQSAYETASHIDVNNSENPIYGYDGLFYPKTLNLLSSDDAFQSFIDNIIDDEPDGGNGECGYYGLDLTLSARQFIVGQLSEFRSAILCCAGNPYDISRYGVDIYGNSYALVKNLSANSIDEVQRFMPDDKADVCGTLWIKLKNHPLAFPAYVLSSQDGNYGNYMAVSQCYVKGSNDTDANQAFISNKTYHMAMSKDYGPGSDSAARYTPAVYDFQFSNDKTYAIVEVAARNLNDGSDSTLARWPLIMFPNRQYVKTLDRHVFRLAKYGDTEYLFKDGLQHIYGSAYGDKYDFREYKFACWLRSDIELGVAYWKMDDDKVNIVFTGYNVQNDSDKRIVGGIDNVCNVQLCAGPSDGIVRFDSYCGGISKQQRIVMAYIAAVPDGLVEDESTNYQCAEFKYNDLKDYIGIFDKQVVTQDYVILKQNAQMFMLTVAQNSEEHYLPYAECGFNPVHAGTDNKFYATALAKQSQRKARGIIKFQAFAPSCDASQMIDFKNVLPARLHDEYKSDTSLSLAEFGQLHVLESESERAAHQVELGDEPIYEPIEFSRLVNTADISAIVDEEYINFVSEYGYADDPIDHDISYLYLWKYGEDEIPDKYVYAFKSDLDLAYKDNMVLMIRGDSSISVSYGKNPYTDDIQIDFNSYYYYGRTDKDDDLRSNIFNRKHMFLNLEKPGCSGCLYTYENIADPTPVAKYYIKNISENGKVKFILSAFFEDDPDDVNADVFITELKTVDENESPVPDSKFNIIYNSQDYSLAVER